VLEVEKMNENGMASKKYDPTDRTVKKYDPADPRGEYLETTNEADIIKSIMASEGTNNPAMGYMLGIDRNAVWQRLNNQRRMSVPMLVEMAHALGYRVVIEPVVKNVYGTNGEVVRTREKYEVRG
jgi:hypothetical protein